MNTMNPMIRRACLPNKNNKVFDFLNVFGFRNTTIGRPAFQTAFKDGKEINISRSKKMDSQFFKQQDVRSGNYIDFLLKMTSLRDKQQPNVFRGTPLYINKNSKVAFGGCLMGQAASAAVCSVPQGQLLHSFHNSFLNAGRQGCIDYRVETVRNGRIYCNRIVHAEQNGKTILNMQVSFKKDEAEPFQHQRTMPDCKKPEELLSIEKLIEKKLSEDLSEEQDMFKDLHITDPVVEFRPVDEETLYRLKPLPPKSLLWMRITEKQGEDENFHRCAVATMSDCNMLSTVILPKENGLKRFRLASLNHSMWFHNNVRADDWLLYETESSYAGGGVGFCTGRLWTQDGVLAASVSQEGVVRSLL